MIKTLEELEKHCGATAEKIRQHTGKNLTSMQVMAVIEGMYFDERIDQALTEGVEFLAEILKGTEKQNGEEGQED